jgi:hypothetical protein
MKEMIMKKTQFGLLTLLLGMSLSTSVFAHDSIGFSLNIGEPYYYDPQPVYYAPPPVVYYEPRPVYHEYSYSNPKVYFYPRNERYSDNYGRRDHHEYREHHRHHEHDDDED